MKTLTTEALQCILQEHLRWLKGDQNAKRANLRLANLRLANLSLANLSLANLSLADLSSADLSSADLSSANLSLANLRSANLRSANLSSADLSSADLSSADLSSADLSSADLRSADLRWANLRSADLSLANLSLANLSLADLRLADLRLADLSSAKNLLDPVAWLQEHFERDPENRGVIVYKFFNLNYIPPSHWKLEPGSVITEVVNPDRTVDCACGVNVATREWLATNSNSREIWRCLIRWEWLAGVVVPYHNDGKIRCSHVELLEIINPPIVAGEKRARI